MLSRVLCLILFTTTHCLFGQMTLSGKILDVETGIPVDYVNIGIIDKAQGTVSDNDGTFTFSIIEAKPADTVQISRIGYSPLKFSLQDLEHRLMKNPVIEMQEELLVLNEVAINQKEAKKHLVGYTRITKGLVGYWNNSRALGGEHASKIMVRKGPVKLEDLSFQVVKSISDSLLVRVNVYEIDKGLPGRNISRTNILYTIKKNSGRMIIDLSPYDIVVDDHFIVSLELLKIYGGQVGMTIAAYNDGYRSYSRLISQDRWRRMRKGTTIAFNLNTSPVEKSAIASLPAKKKNKKPQKVKILWDNSLSMKGRNLDKEITYLDSFFKKLGDLQLSFQTFGYETGKAQVFEISKGNWEVLRKFIEQTENDGSGRKKIMEQLEPKGFTLIFTDGQDFYEDINRNWLGKIYPVNSNTKANHELLAAIAEESGADYINLADRLDIKMAADYKRMQGNYISKNRNQFTSQPQYKEIKGNVSDFDDPIEQVLVEVKNSKNKTRTNAEGNFTIQAEAGETLSFTYPGRNNVEAVVGHSTSNLIITMPLGIKVLDEVVLEKDRKVDELNTLIKQTISTNFGTLDPQKTGFAIKQIQGDKLNWASHTLMEALKGKFPGIRIVGSGVLIRVGSNKFAGWDIDGVVYAPSSPPLHVNIQDVTSITIMPGSWAFARYGMLGAGGIVIVRTTKDSMIGIEASNDPLFDQARLRDNFYKGEAVFPEEDVWNQPIYIQNIDKAVSLEEAYDYYLRERNTWDKHLEFYVDVQNHFITKWQSSVMASLIISNIAEVFGNDIIALRLLAYSYEKNGFIDNALEVYKKILDLSSDQLQSKRDLAHAYTKTEDYKHGWSLYKEYLNSRNDSLDADGLDKIVRQEMLDLVEKNHNVLGLKKDDFTLDSDQEDISIIVQWNNPNAEFELQFVGPSNQYYIWKHTGLENGQLLFKERETGAFSKSFSIQDIGEGPWMINSRYLGNKENTATYLKFTIKNNKKTTENIKVLKLNKSDINYRLLNISEKEVISLFK